jgi:hypothetical protein
LSVLRAAAAIEEAHSWATPTPPSCLPQ